MILDFDGTLADSWPWARAALCDLASRFGLPPLGAAEAETLRGEEPHAVLRRLGVPAWRLPAIAAELRRRVAAAPPPPLFPGIPDLLERLAAAGIPLAIASSNSAAQIHRTLGPELGGLIAHVAAEASLFGKAARFRRILRACGIAPAAALAIGDEVRDIAAARAAGVGAGAVAWGYATPALLRAHRPDAIFASPAEILAFCGIGPHPAGAGSAPAAPHGRAGASASGRIAGRTRRTNQRS